MGYQCGYKTPDGFSDLVMRSDGAVLTGLWFEKTRDERKHPAEREEKDLEIFRQTRNGWIFSFGRRNSGFYAGIPAGKRDGFSAGSFRTDESDSVRGGRDIRVHRRKDR